MMQRWFLEAKGAVEISNWTNDQLVCEWLQQQLDTEASTGSCQISRNMQQLRHHNIVHKVKEIIEEEQPKTGPYSLFADSTSLPASSTSPVSQPIEIKRSSNPPMGSSDMKPSSPDATSCKFYDLVEDTVSSLLEYLPQSRRIKFVRASHRKSLDEENAAAEDKIDNEQ